ncbi:larval cuticle protein A2B-like [Topomyia yanbarensis]|uniref:larval cuticle protein A2B-like n=1 Tax=Topomyia yanbarensis TaxID=2498891 RepID=UPI00273BDDD8|nr:larval cuticle protein A2B-like [Topomyia yanbarensis]
MAFKLIVLAAIVAVANSIAVGVGYPAAYPALGVAKVAAPVIAKAVDDYDPNPQYSFSYHIADALTGDNKEQQESRSGDVVTGSYALVEPDGTRRVVEYTADPVNGFNAVVHREPLAVKAVAPIAKVAAPLGYPAYGRAIVG